MRHTRTGWWLEEADAASVEPNAPLQGEITADIAIVGGGYLGLWTAWHLKQLAPGSEIVVLEAELAGHGPSGRNGGFVSTLWDDVGILTDSVGATRAVEVARASERGVHGIETFLTEHGIDAWFRKAPTIYAATSDDHYHHFAESIEACRAVGAPEEMTSLTASEVQARVASPLLREGVLVRLAATVHPARLALGLRAKVLEAGVRLHERTRVTGISDHGVTTGRGRVRAGAVVLAANSQTGLFPGYRLAHAVASSHIVLTEPVPDVLDELGWTGGEALGDGRTLLHYTRTTRDGRIAFGWGGGRMGFGARPLGLLDVDPEVIRQAAEHLVRFFPGLRGRRITHAWGGPIDVSPTHLPIFGSRGRVCHGFGFTGNGVGPSYLGGEILARLALDHRDELTRLAIVDPARKLFPPEPFRWAGGSLIRTALVRRDAAQEAGRPVGPLTSFVASLPRRLGLRLPR